MAGGSLLAFVTLCESIAATTKKTAKRQLLEDYFRAQPVESAALAAIFLTGRPFAAYDERTLQVGGRLLWQVILEIAELDADDDSLSQAYRRHGDLGSATADILAAKARPEPTLMLKQVSHVFDEIAAARNAAARLHSVHDLLAKCSAVEAKYVVKIITGDLRIGLRESLVEEAVAQAFSVPLEDVRRANMFLGDIGETLRLARAQKLAEARMRLFHPIGFMLASPADTAQEAFAAFAAPHIAASHVEDKYDGIRAQIHCGDPAQPGRVRIFSRTFDDITGSFPELVPFFAAAPMPLVLDGEILAWENDSNQPNGRARPFADLQKRIGRKQVSAALLRSVPVIFLCFDVLYAQNELLIERPLTERMQRLDEILSSLIKTAPNTHASRQPAQAHMFDLPDQAPSVPLFLRAPVTTAHSAHELESLFDLAQGRGNEGLMIKDPASPYTPGRRGGAWLKLKRELATLDVVITAAEYGHGRRAQWLSDYTFAIRDGEQLQNVGKAYSGVTDEEIKELTTWCKTHTLVDHGQVRTVTPEIVLEVAFNNVMISDRHDSGFALRFPRILRIRRDKSAKEIDTLERVREIYEKQKINKS